MPGWFVYFLVSTHRDWIYVEMTRDVARRVNDHNEELVQSTKSYRPLKLVAYIAVETGNKARELEQYFKVGSGKAILKRRILTDEVRLFRIFASRNCWKKMCDGCSRSTIEAKM